MPLLCPKSVDIFLFSLLVHEILHAVEHFRHKIKHAVDRCRRRDGHGHHARQTVLDDEERDGVDLDARTRAAAMIADAEKQVKLAVGGIQEQTRQVFRNIKAIVEAAGLTMDNVVKTTVFLQHMSDFAAMNAVYAEFFTEGQYPARSAVEVGALPRGALVEIETICVK